ncbi:MAG: hypothetical protein GTN76_09585 [Candidatus Aenigmarchaeota archaeon]|nr:hypothetical protein [Candidatus Aenigmarchaeota archaeon]
MAQKKQGITLKGEYDMYFHSVLTFFILILLASSVKSCGEYERVFVFRLGRLILPPKGPGIFLIIPIVDKMLKISLRSEKDLEEAERLLWEAKTQRSANQMEIERHLNELAEIRKNLSHQGNGRQEADQAGI